MKTIDKITVFDAVQRLTSIHPDYMNRPIQDGFNWTACFDGLYPGEWYLIVFRSRHRQNIDIALLNEHDERALGAARASAGFVGYFVGTANEQGDCLSFCFWESQAQARLAAAQPAHQAAQQLAFEMYEHFQLERYRLRTAGDLEQGTVIFERL